ncbi:hypothetical protein Patl1_34718 [Pistacia atlantica]|uniref:Uncharacterized protein n=1 Tax=Pistacia atlantica TaxID=434234 RepID=A0ACC0ZWS4_9ROSI|nr:hypothetical protein Patl1_34718 [Pistacia atlantica]
MLRSVTINFMSPFLLHGINEMISIVWKLNVADVCDPEYQVDRMKWKMKFLGGRGQQVKSKVRTIFLSTNLILV